MSGASEGSQASIAEEMKVLRAERGQLKAGMFQLQQKLERLEKRLAALETKLTSPEARLSRPPSNSLLHSSSPLLVSATPRSEEAKIEIKEVEQLLRHVVYGEQDEAEALAQKKPVLLLCKGTVTDLSRREFKEITGFQYALWALDWHMWEMLLKYLPKEEAALQWQELEMRGTAHGTQVSWQGLIDGYKAYISIAPIAASSRDWSKAKTVWAKQIGGAQLLLPIHVVNEYCHTNRAFDPLPDFKRVDMELTRTRKSGGIDWYDDRIGRDWAHFRYNCKESTTTPYCDDMYGYPIPLIELKAVSSLLEVRQRQRAELGKRLEPVLRSLAVGDALDCCLPPPLLEIVKAYESCEETLVMSL